MNLTEHVLVDDTDDAMLLDSKGVEKRKQKQLMITKEGITSNAIA